MFHGVADANKNSLWQPTWGRTSCNEFETALKKLGKKYSFISIDTAVRMLSGKEKLRPYSMVLTFDDGYSNNFSHAWPVLKKYRGEMTVYVATNYVKNRKAFWIDHIDYALFTLRGHGKVEVLIAEQVYTFDLSTKESHEKSFANFRAFAKSLHFEDDYKFLKALEDVAMQLEVRSGHSISEILESDPWSRPVKEEELGSLEEGLHIGAHTVSHIRTTHVDDQALLDELHRSRTYLEKAVGKKCDHFCYPNGDFNQNSINAVKKSGYHSAVSCKIGSNCVGDDMFALKRLPFPSLSIPENIDFWLAKQLFREFFSAH